MNPPTNTVSKLNDMQDSSVLYFGSPLLILAGAGSGKTRVLTHKIAYLIKEMHVSAYNIFAVTFTNKAADEMKTRVEHLVGISVKGMWIGTFHSMCVRMIKMHRRMTGLNPDFSIYDTDDSKSVLREIISSGNYDKKIDHRTAHRVISSLKNKMISCKEYESTCNTNLDKDIYDIYSKYQSKLKQNDAFDFDDLLLETVEILKRDENFKSQLQTVFKYILVDEYQDTNYVQYVMLKELYSGKNHITVVGDDDQSIYGFRGAEVGNILNFDKDFENTHIIKMEQNYRSTKKILFAANKIISNNSSRKEKQLWSDLKDGDNVILVRAVDESDEANYIVKEILNLKDKKALNLKDFAILYRTNAQSRPFEEQFRRYNIRYTVVGAIKFFERKEIKDILAYLSIIINPRDNVSLRRVINSPKRGIGDKTISMIEEYAEQKGVSLLESIRNYKNFDNPILKNAVKGLNSFLELYDEIIKNKDDVYEAIINLIEKSKYETVFDNLDNIEKTSKLENIQELLNSAKEFCDRNEEHRVSDYMDMISLYMDIDEFKDYEDSVTIMTVHNAKGLEFNTVFISGVEEGLFPHFNSFDSQSGIEEERRLMYVAMTRAKENLYIAYAESRKRYGSSGAAMASRFINELPEKNIDIVNRGYSPRKIAHDFSSFTEENPINEESNEIVRRIEDDIIINDKVIHPYWGDGIVRGIKGSGEDKIAIVHFNSGETKKIFVKYANMKRK